MLLPFALPDEIYSSYLGRIIRCNGFEPVPNISKKFLQLIYQHFSQPAGSGDAQMLATLALSTKLSSTDFIKEHTFVPYRSGIVSATTKTDHGLPVSNRERSCFVNTKLISPSCRFCTDCIEDDLRKYGMAYWRRIHQLPGVYMCPVHSIGLRYAEGQQWFSYSPSTLVGKSQLYTENLIAACTIPSVKKFVSLSILLLQTSRSTKRGAIWLAFRPIGEKYGYVSPPHKSKQTVRVSDQVMEAFPIEWLEMFFPHVHEKEQGELFRAIDNAMTRGSHPIYPISYLLVACVVLEAYESLVQLLLAARH